MNSPAADLRFPSIDGLRAFEAAARLGSFERAAEELCVTASAIGKRVGAVEELIGSLLFTRGAKSLRLTASGREYLEQVRSALQLLAAMPQHRRGQQRALKLRVTTPPTFARQVLVPLLPGFVQAHPHIELELVLSVPYLDRSSADSDLEVRHGDPATLGGLVLMREQVTPVAAPALLQRLPPLLTPADLVHAPLLRTPIEPWAPWLQAAGVHLDEPERGPRLVDLGLVLEAAIEGQGVALARPSLARRALQAGSLRPLWPVSAGSAAQYQLMPHAGDEAAAPFAAWLPAACAQWAADAAAELAERLSGGA
jgi:LysR family transcriptional regulator, glycine cleavage system transcriptional activator